MYTRGPDNYFFADISNSGTPFLQSSFYNQENRADLLDVFASGFNYMSSTIDRILIYSSISPCFAIPPRFCSFTLSQRSFPGSTSSDLLHLQSTVVGPINRAWSSHQHMVAPTNHWLLLWFSTTVMSSPTLLASGSFRGHLTMGTSLFSSGLLRFLFRHHGSSMLVLHHQKVHFFLIKNADIVDGLQCVWHSVLSVNWNSLHYGWILHWSTIVLSLLCIPIPFSE